MNAGDHAFFAVIALGGMLLALWYGASWRAFARALDASVRTGGPPAEGTAPPEAPPGPDRAEHERVVVGVVPGGSPPIKG